MQEPTCSICISHNGEHNVATNLYSTYPIRVLEKQNETRTNAIILFILGFGGGYVSGDEVITNCHVRVKATLCLRSPGTTKIYKSVNGLPSKQSSAYRVEAGGLLIASFDPVTCYKDSIYQQKQVYNIECGGSAIILDWFTCGRKECGEVWVAKSINSHTSIFINQALVYAENLVLTASAGAQDKLGYCSIFGSLILLGKRTEYLRYRLKYLKQRQSFEQYATLPCINRSSTSNSRFTDPMVSVSEIIPNECMVVRVMADSPEDAYQLIREMLYPSTDSALVKVDESIVYCDLFRDRLHGGMMSESDAEERISSIRNLRFFDQSQANMTTEF